MSYYNHWSGILQKAAKGFRLQKQRPNQDSWHFQLSHCCFILAPTFLPFLTSTNNNKSVAWFFWKKWERHWNFDIFDWKLVLSSISQGQSYNQKVALFRCPSDLTNFVKICAFVQSLEVILERSDSLGWELPVLISKEDYTGVKTERARSERELILGPTYLLSSTDFWPL